MSHRTEPSRRLCPSAGNKALRYVPADKTDIRRTFERARRLQRLQHLINHTTQ